MRVGGKLRSKRLRKKYNKWFDWYIKDLLESTIEVITPGEMKLMFGHVDHDFSSLWLHIRSTENK